MVFTSYVSRPLAAAVLLSAAATLTSATSSLRSLRLHRGDKDAPEHLETLDRAIRLMNNRHHHKACLSIAERESGFMGGFANGVGFVNSVYDFAKRYSAEFVFPRLVTKAHQDGSNYDHIFGKPSEETCLVTKYEAECDKHQPHDEERDWSRERHRCDLKQFVVDMNSGTETEANACGCQALVAVDLEHMQWHFDYTATHHWLRLMYWEAQKAQQQQQPKQQPKQQPCQRNVALHIRLGDVAAHRDAGANWAEKYIEPDTYVTMLRALAAVVPAKCVNLSILTDGEARDPEPRAVADGAKKLGMAEPTMMYADTLAQDAFSTLTHADVLICGGSGFCRLAAVLAKRQVARICLETKTHPVYFLPNVTELQLPGSTAEYNMTDSEVLHAVRANKALQAMAPH